LAAAGIGSVIVLAMLARSDAPPAESASLDVEGKTSRSVTAEERADAIARAHAWRAPATPIARASLRPDVVSQMDCRFTIADLGGTTPKFHCLLDTGSEVRAKYGRGGEIPAEAAATRLLSVLGFGADAVTLVERLRCYGCPSEPFVTTKIVDRTGTRGIYERVVGFTRYEEFEWVAVEEKFTGRAIEGEDTEGWGFFELDFVDPSKGGAPRAHVDALRLMAVFLAHWDNKADNQRLVCLSDPWQAGAPCGEPFLLLQDVGATFGPNKVDLDAWERAPLWEDRATCTTSMRHLPYKGGTFRATRISDGGRQFLAMLLGQLTDAQLNDLFTGARFDKPRNPLNQSKPVSEWVRVFRSRVKAISEGPPCPDA
jgi:hypothetical protein